ncbi:molecular chaperone [Vibrio alginolyticus]|uniref:fimbrial biogenesis chaperone n=1 Tax=Vibrio alginolyticus TaxID=663 RepID=UPI002160F9AA|nr:molecular chaperone [Vibrio alginolyticus]MCS0217020.1 molecular chaperone [Vibrio alginolyticus]
MIRKILILTFIYFFHIAPSISSVTINQTRVVFNEDDKVATITLNNNNDNSSLIQMWIDNGELDAEPSTIDVPFIINPQIKELKPKQAQVVKINYVGDVFIKNEGLYWLNLLEVPKKAESGKNYIQLAYRTRIKLFYRPTHLSKLSQSKSSEELEFVLTGSILEIKNESPFHVTITDIQEKIGEEYKVIENSSLMIPPKSSKEIIVDEGSYFRNLKYTYINDWGGKKEVIKSLGN